MANDMQLEANIIDFISQSSASIDNIPKQLESCFCHVATGSLFHLRGPWISKCDLKNLQYPIVDFITVDGQALIISCPLCNQTNCDGNCIEFGDPVVSHDGFSQLPQELKLKVQSYLTPQELCRVVPFVCREWRLLAYDSSLWNTFVIDTPLSPNLLAYLFRRSGSSLRELMMNSDYRVALGIAITSIMVWSRFLPVLTKLKFPKLFGYKVPLLRYYSREAGMFDVLRENCSNIQEFYVNRGWVIGEADLKAIAKWKHLRVVDLSRAEVALVKSDCVKVLAESPSMYRSLSFPPGCNESSVSHVVDHHSATLEKLVAYCNLSDDSLLPTLVKCHTLRELHLLNCVRLSDKFLLCIKELDNLTKLSIQSGSNLSSNALVSLFQGGHLNNLTHLNLTRCYHVDDEVVTAILDTRGASLVDLNLHCCGEVTTASDVKIIKMCQDMRGLTLKDSNHDFDIWEKEVPNKETRSEIVRIEPSCIRRETFHFLSEASRLVVVDEMDVIS